MDNKVAKDTLYVLKESIMWQGERHSGSSGRKVAQAIAARAGENRLLLNLEPGGDLNPKEKEVLQLVAEGFSSAEIAGKLQLSLNTVDAYRSHIVEKLLAESLREAVVIGVNYGLIDTGRIVDDASIERINQLSAREKEVFGLIASGESNQEVGLALFITEGTVESHISNILNKLEIKTKDRDAHSGARTVIKAIVIFMEAKRRKENRKLLDNKALLIVK